jgi:hypothetical protein
LKNQKLYHHLHEFINSVKDSKDPASTAFTYIAALYLNINISIDDMMLWVALQTADDWVRLLFSIGLIYVGHKAFRPDIITLKDEIK